MIDPMEEGIEIMEAYLEGTLSEDARKAFDEKLRTDSHLAESFKSFRASHQAIIRHSRDELKNRLKNLESEQNKKIPYHYQLLAIAASLVALVTITTYLLTTSPSPQSLYHQYYTLYPNVVSPIERNQLSSIPYAKPFQLYESGDYDKALPLFKKLLQKKPQQPELNFYAGLCALELGNPQQAILYLQQVKNNDDAKFAAQATWYIALAYLAQSHEDLAIKELKSLRSNEYYKDKAQELLNSLD